MSSKLDRLKKFQGGKWKQGKISELILDFARPLLDAMKPTSVEDYNTAMMLATMCWNLPVIEKAGGEDAKKTRRLFDERIDLLPHGVAKLVLQLVESRKTEFVQIPFYILAEARGTTLDNCRIHAEARQPPGTEL